MTLSTHYGSALCWWAMDNPDPTFTALMDGLKADQLAGRCVDHAYGAVRDYRDPRFDYVEGLHTWGGGAFTKRLKPEHRAAFDEWCLANAKGQFDHDKEAIYLSMSGTSAREGVFITIDPKDHPPPHD